MHNLEALDKGYYEVAGQAMALSLAQGGPAPAFFAEWVYTYICTQDISKRLSLKHGIWNYGMELWNGMMEWNDGME